MSELINKEKLLDTIKPMVGMWNDGDFWINYQRVLDIIESAEPERKNGKWIDAVLYHEPDDFEWEKVKCSSCKIFVTKPIFYHNNKYNFCPNCGADMRSE